MAISYTARLDAREIVRRAVRLGALLALAAAPAARAAGPDAAPFKLEGLSGGKHELSSARGSVVMLLFLSDECGACHEEVVVADEIYRRHKAAGLQVFGILSAKPQPASSLRDATFPLLLGNDDVNHAYHVSGRPLVYLLDRDHRLAAKHRGWSEGRGTILEAEVRQLLGGEDINEQGLDLYGALGSWDGHWVPGTLRRLRTDEVIPYLASADQAERRWAIVELGRRRSREGVAMLGSMLVSEREALSLRREALASLRLIRSPEAAGSYLRAGARRENAPLLRGESVLALADVLDQPKVREAIPGLVGDPDPNVRLAAASVAGEGCLAEARPALEQARAREVNDWVRSGIDRALAALAACGAPAGSPAP